MAATQQMAIRMTVDASSMNADLSRVVNEFSKFIDRISSGASQAEEAKAKAVASAKEVASSFQSLFSSIQGGQSPLTSLVGEGTKLISSFGGVGSAAGAVGGYIKGLLSPLSLATQAVTTLTDAYVQGSKEATGYANARILSGNYAGQTNDQLQAQAVEIAGTKGTQARAAEALTAAVGTGKVGGEVLREVAGATAEMNRVLGTSISEATENFVKLADEPSKASAKLNETYHYLSASTYERIKALEDQGRHEDAAALAQKSFADAMNQRTQQVVGNLGTMDRAWMGIIGTINRAGDAIRNIGRAEPMQKKIDEVSEQIERYRKRNGNDSGKFAETAGGAAVGFPKKNNLETLTLQQSYLQNDQRLLSKDATLQGERARVDQKGIKAGETLTELRGRFNKKDEVAAAVELYRKSIADAKAASLAVPTAVEQAREVAALKKSFTPKGDSSGINRAEDEGLRAGVEAVREAYSTKAKETAEGLKKIDSLRKQDLLTDYDVVRRKRDLRLQDLKDQEDAIQEELRLLGSKKGSAADRQKLEVRSKTVEQQRKFVNDEADRSYAELDATPRNAVLKTSQQATDKIREQTRALEEQNAVYGLSKEEIQKLSIAQMERQVRELDATENVDPAYIQSLRDRLRAEQDLLQATQKSDSLKTTDEKQKKEKAKDEEKSKKMADDIGGVFRDGFVNLLEGGGRDAIDKIGEGLKKKLVKSLADAFYDATLKDAVDGFAGWLTGALKGSISGGGASDSKGSSSGLGGLFGAVSGLLGGAWTSATAGVSNLLGGDTLGTFIGLKGWTPSANANGNVFSSSGLHAYANSVVGSPTFFPFANGIGLMGEAGPEAIMPLRRGSDGRLGVSAQGSDGGGGSGLHYAPTNVFNIDSRSDRGAVLADLDRALQANNKGQMEQLKRLRVVPQ
ncbi:phage tail length tape measure family protein [Variovorax sp. PAMC26660]|uniref:phage tail length tape measure family protein n=1 Tax=Variovorax sp. PAMC26660 TaxID=2762322 RepID=UPI00164DB473|nr:phage tail length tape measure family protein [Variovorax sp. PAMC26660]QNK70254.1 phage tail length tape measure family protein [Variovorax sp. PAMC26660]